MRKIVSAVLSLCLSLCVTVPAFAASAVPAASVNFKSNTGEKLSIEAGKSYEFKITALNGKKPAFVIPGKAFTVTGNGSKGKNYYFTVKAVGKAGARAGVYIDGQKKPSTVITITPAPKKSAFTIDTGSKVTVHYGKTYQFKITSKSKPAFFIGNTSIFKMASSRVRGDAYYYKIKAVGKPGQSANIYVNGSHVTTCTINK